MNKDKFPKVVIGVCTYNRCLGLKRLLQSLIKLDYPNFEIIVVDNNSTDQTAKIISEFEKVKYIFEARQGLAYSVAVNRAYTPELSVSSFYRSLVRETDDPEARQYIVKKVSQAEWLISCIRQREETLLRCCQEILKRQLPYFRSGQALAPMTMQDIAQVRGSKTGNPNS